MWLLPLLLAFQSGRTIEAGSTVTAVLSDSSAPAPGGRRAEIFGFQCVSALAIQVDVTSSWDNLLVLLTPDGRTAAQDDDSGGNNNARITWTCPDNQLYRIAVESYHVGVGGPFTLAVTRLSAPGSTQRLPGGERIAGEVGIESEVHGTIGPGAAQYAGHPIVVYGFRCRSGQEIGISAFSEFDNLLYVFGDAGEVARNDDANGTSAALTFRCPDDSRYRIGVAALQPGAGGPFRLNVRNLSLPTGPIAAGRPPRPRGAPLLFPGSRVEGLLSTDADLFENRPAVSYSLQCQGGLPLRIDVTSTWDNVAWLLSATAQLARNDDAGGTTNASIGWRCPDGGVYTIVVGANNPSSVGTFTLTVTPTGVAQAPTGVAAGPPIVGTLYPGAVIEGNLLADATTRSGRPTDLYVLQCVAGSVVRLSMTARFDHVLSLEDSTGKVLVAGDALEWTCPDAAMYRVGASGRTIGDLGRYRLIMR